MSEKSTPQLNSNEFLEKIKKRDEDTVSFLVRKYTNHLLKASLGMGFEASLAEELVQRVWVTFFDVAPGFEGRSHIRTFLFGILYNKAHELRRELGKHGDTDPIEEAFEAKFSEQGHWLHAPLDPVTFMQKAEVLEVIQNCVEKLPLSQKMAFYLKEVEGSSRQEICKILEVTTTNLGVLLYRAKNRLRECIEHKSKRL